MTARKACHARSSEIVEAEQPVRLLSRKRDLAAFRKPVERKLKQGQSELAVHVAEEHGQLEARGPYGNLRIASLGVHLHWKTMHIWKKIRLELARTRGFPSGSVSRGYLIQVPLDVEGQIDGAAIAKRPHMATVRRYWSSEPDESGFVVPAEGAWTLRCNGGPDRSLLLGGQPIRLGEQVSVIDPDGAVLPFRVAGIR